MYNAIDTPQNPHPLHSTPSTPHNSPGYAIPTVNAPITADWTTLATPSSMLVTHMHVHYSKCTTLPPLPHATWASHGLGFSYLISMGTTQATSHPQWSIRLPPARQHGCLCGIFVQWPLSPHTRDTTWDTLVIMQPRR